MPLFKTLRPARRLLDAATVLFVSAVAACDSPARPTPPPTLALTCPANIDQLSRDGNATSVTFQTPTAQGGRPPVTTVCSPGSGSTFNIGSTTATCTASDAAGQGAACSFVITIRRPPMISRTAFLAFGDSLTSGGLQLVPSAFSPGVPASYPFKLQAALAARYTAQSIQMENAGRGGERATEGIGRLQEALARFRPQVVTLMDGVNDIANGEAFVRSAADAVRRMVRDARASGAIVFLATLPPQRPGGSRAHSPQLIAPYNVEMRRIAMEEGSILVDVFGGFDLSLLGSDGLHFTDAGYERVSQIFFDSVRQNLEVPVSSLSHGEYVTRGR